MENSKSSAVASGAMPAPGVAANAHSERLCQHIRALIAASPDQKMTFADFMAEALYAPGLGYYSAGSVKFGSQGDFTTAAELSSYYGRCLARHCAVILTASGGGILEVGAGSGAMAAALLTELEVLQCLPEQYAILELSADLRQRQQAFLLATLPEALFRRLCWLDRLPEETFNGVILANELLDAMPIHRLCRQGQDWQEICVTEVAGELCMAQREITSERLLSALQAIQEDCEPLPDGYVIELGLAASDWIKAIADMMGKASLLIVDYGYPRTEFYHPQRENGTLLCYFRHHAHDNPLSYVGLQDITAHIDFTAIALAANDSALSVDGFTTQASFLLGCGLLDMVSAEAITADPVLAQQLQTLLMPGSMGEVFKVMALSRGLEELSAGPGFSLRDERYRL